MVVFGMICTYFFVLISFVRGGLIGSVEKYLHPPPTPLRGGGRLVGEREYEKENEKKGKSERRRKKLAR